MIGAFNFTVLDWSEEIVNWIIRIIVAAACGFVIGMERKSRSKEAGIRTHTIVCMAAAIMMIVSKYGFTDMGEKASDYGRIAAQVVSGIGFLGAGIIFYKRDFLHGLTTAAGIWATSGIGLAIGAGMILVGVFSTLVLVLLQIVLHRPLKFLKGKTTNVLKMSVILVSPDIIDKITYIFDVKKFLKFKTVTGENGVVTADIEAATEVSFSAKELYEFTKAYDFIKTLEKTDEL
ncbi:MAG: MgtC/SapB family protein [Christensenellales bacterium]